MEGKIVKKPKSKKPYCNNEDLYKALMLYYDSITIAQEQGKKEPSIPNYIGECILQIPENLANKYKFNNYTFKDEMIGDAIEKITEAVILKKFDPSLSNNPFAYFTQISWNSFLQRIRKESIETYVLHKNMDKIVCDVNELEIVDQHVFDLLKDENHIMVIDNFEKPKEKNNYAKHANLSYSRNKKKKNNLTIEEVSDINIMEGENYEK